MGIRVSFGLQCWRCLRLLVLLNVGNWYTNHMNMVRKKVAIIAQGLVYRKLKLPRLL